MLIPGWLNNRNYWDLPYGDGEYSYVRFANQRGEATLALDRLGTGASWHPPSASLTYQTHVSTIAQVVDALHTGALAPGLTSIVLIGHSYGSRIAYGVASTTNAVDAVVATSLRQNWISYLALTASPVTTGVATQNPRFADDDLDPGYVATLPQWSGTGYNRDNADPNVIAVAEQTVQDVGSTFEAPTARDALPTQSAGINIPVLIVVGSADNLTCGPAAVDCPSAAEVAARERGLFGPAASVSATVVSGSGHALNLERTRHQAWNSIGEFVDKQG
ncbi:alpha/beta hydrolase [Nocardia fluminea]|uniref:alpha/beta hydrolase n=1 Tax=Nocardia fluminea TaxID=134984 RepID=UPI003D13858E